VNFPSNRKIHKLEAYEKYLYHQFSQNHRSMFRRYVIHFFASIIARFIGLIRCFRMFMATSTKVDFLFLPVCKQDAQRLEKISDILEQSGFSVVTEVQQNFKGKLRASQFCWVPLSIPIFLTVAYSNAVFYVRKFQPKIIVFVQNTGVFPSVIRSILDKDGLTVNISHSVTFSDALFSSFDFDYYLMFGKSSLQHAKKNKFRYGDTKIVLTGSPFVGASLSDLKRNLPNKTILYCSQWVQSGDVYETYRSHEILIEYARRNPYVKVYIKLHPIENGMYWKRKVSDVQNVTVLDSGDSLISALKKVSVCVVASSNVAIEATLAHRPIVSIDISGIADEYLNVSRYFPRAKNIDDFESAMLEVFSKYDYYLDRCKDFSCFHMEYLSDSQKVISNCLSLIFRGDDVHCDEKLKETYSWSM